MATIAVGGSCASRLLGLAVAMTLRWVSAGIEGVLRGGILDLPDTEPFKAERRWAVARTLTGQTSRLACQPLPAAEVHTAARQFQARLSALGAPRGRPSRHSRLVVSAMEADRLARETSTEELTEAGDMIQSPNPVPDASPAGTRDISGLYSEETLRQLTEEVYRNALIIYHDLVDVWFPRFAHVLGLMSILPVIFHGLIVPRTDSLTGPDFYYDMDVLPPGAPANAEVRVVPEPPTQEWSVTIEKMRQLRDRIRILHPGADRWAHPSRWLV